MYIYICIYEPYTYLYIWATISILDSSAISRMDVRFYIGIAFWALLDIGGSIIACDCFS